MTDVQQEDASLIKLSAKRKASEREANREAWIQYFKLQAASHTKTAARFANRALELENGRSK